MSRPDEEEVEVRRVVIDGRREMPPSAGCGWLLLKWLAAALAVYLAAVLLGGVHVEGFIRALLVALVLGLLNIVLRPLLILLTLPITLLTLGLFLIVINALILMLAGWMLDGFEIDGFGWALLAALLIALINLALEALIQGLVDRRSES